MVHDDIAPLPSPLLRILAMRWKNQLVKRDQQPCPCCGHLTLRERGGFEVCPVCFWEDDGQDDVDAHVDRGGPNGGTTLWQARANFLEFGACERAAKQHARPPTPDEPRTGQWSLLDGVAVERIPSTDVSPWNLLHDGTIMALARGGDRLSVTVDIPYLRTRMQEPGAAFLLELCACTELEYAPYEGDSLSSLEEIAGAEPDIVEAEHEDGRVVVWGSAGVLRLRYQDLALRFDNGAPLALAALDECARAYWEDWERGLQGPDPP